MLIDRDAIGSRDMTSPIGRAALTPREEDAQLRLDFAAFAQHCFRELNPLTRLR